MLSDAHRSHVDVLHVAALRAFHFISLTNREHVERLSADSCNLVATGAALVWVRIDYDLAAQLLSAKHQRR